ncbi:MAG TPA: hypothetical protein VKG80_01450 [Trebonia sp.]|nr:hypothetical protein [Trebonia sp.]
MGFYSVKALLAAFATVATVLGLNAVSCSSATFCAAVGSQGDSAHPARGDVPLTMIWSGKSWTLVTAS